MAELKNQRRHDKSALAYTLNAMNPRQYVYIVCCSYSRSELLERIEREANDPAKLERVLKFNNLKHLTQS